MRHLVLGTAGHIDHGKSKLVLALTGTDPDRLKEEQRRGITIELGFADVELSAEKVLSIVDVPGHERFVRQMVAGATGIDAVMLVVAADQGVQPQTREHLDICSLLGLRTGVVALTKCDIVDKELVEVLELELRELLEGSFLADAPLVACSAKTGLGLGDLRGALSELFERVPPRPASGVARLPIDRSFVLRGFGSVVTGTLAAGALEEGDDVEVLPLGASGRIRGLQVHHRQVERAVAGQRTAINVQGCDTEEVPRGSTLTRPGALSTTRRFWARIDLLSRAPQALRRGGIVRFHQGTCERSARFRTLSVSPSGSLHAECTLDAETLLVPGDRFILRRPAPVDTVGGGVVVDVAPPRARLAEPAAFEDRALELPAAVLRRLRYAGDSGRTPDELRRVLGASQQEVERVGRELQERGELVQAGAAWFEARVWSDLRSRTQAELEAFHRREPLKTGLPRELLRARSGARMQQDAWRTLLDQLATSGAIRLQGESVAAAGHEIVLDDAQQGLAEKIERGFRQGGLEPPEPQEMILSAERPRMQAMLDLLVAQGRLVRIHDGKMFHAEALADLRAKLREYARQSPTIDVARFKELAGITRKNAIPLLEHLDAERTTRRAGNLREILPG